MTAEDFRRLALSFPDAVESAHMGHPDFRVGGKIFATLTADGANGMVRLSPFDQSWLMRAEPTVFSPASGAWGRAGATMVNLRHAKKTRMREALSIAWEQRAPKSLLKSLARDTPPE